MLRRRDLVWIVVLGVVVIGLEFVSVTMRQRVAGLGFIAAVTAATFLIQKRFRLREQSPDRDSSIDVS